MSTGERGVWKIERRDFLIASAAALFGLSAGCKRALMGGGERKTGLRFGLVTDPHYADAPRNGTRFYRESTAKMREAVARLNGENLAFAAALGDMKDFAQGEPDVKTLQNLIEIEKEFQAFSGPTYHLLGNHDMDNLSKEQVLANIENTGIAKDRSYYGFTSGGVRFIALDACFKSDGAPYDHNNFQWTDANLPPAELYWLEMELAKTELPVIVLAHQRLDGQGNEYIKQAAAVRALFEKQGRVLAVFQGHVHQGGYNLINGIHYYTLKGMVEGTGEENNSYATVEIAENLSVTVTGYRKAVTMELGGWGSPSAA